MKKKTKKKVSKNEVTIKIETPQSVYLKEQDLGPEKEKSKYMIPTTWVSEKQVLKVIQKTPPQHIYRRPGKGGQTFEYVTGTYVTKVLNFVFGWNWDFEIIAHGKEQNQVWVQGKLTVKDDKGHSITKSQFGRADIKFKKDTKEMLDFGNDMKSASTDALKKCASLLGIASDVYGKMEYKQEAGLDVQVQQPPQIAAPQASGKKKDPMDDAILCQGCDNVITPQEAAYSKKMFGKNLCRNCQKDQKK